MRGSRALATLILLGTLGSGCGDGDGPGGDSPTSPSGVLSIRIAAPIETTLGNQAPQQLTATAVRSGGPEEDVTSRAQWSSSNPAVATVSATGELRGVSDGSAQIRATFDGVQGILNITVAQDALSLMSATPAPRTVLSRGSTVTFEVTGSYNLKSRDSGQIELSIWDQDRNLIKRGITQNVTRSAGTVTLRDTVMIPASATGVLVSAVLFPTNRQFATIGFEIVPYPVQ